MLFKDDLSSIILWPALELSSHGASAAIYNPQQVAGQNKLLYGLCRIFERNVSVRLWVFVGAQCPGEQIGSRLLFTLLRFLISQGTTIGLKRFAGQLHAYQILAESRRLTNANLDRLHRLHHRIIVLAPQEGPPCPASNRWVQQFDRQKARCLKSGKGCWVR